MNMRNGEMAHVEWNLRWNSRNGFQSSYTSFIVSDRWKDGEWSGTLRFIDGDKEPENGIDFKGKLFEYLDTGANDERVEKVWIRLNFTIVETKNSYFLIKEETDAIIIRKYEKSQKYKDYFLEKEKTGILEEITGDVEKTKGWPGMTVKNNATIKEYIWWWIHTPCNLEKGHDKLNVPWFSDWFWSGRLPGSANTSSSSSSSCSSSLSNPYRGWKGGEWLGVLRFIDADWDPEIGVEFKGRQLEYLDTSANNEKLEKIWTFKNNLYALVPKMAGLWHQFIIVKTKNWYFSIEKQSDSIVIQKSVNFLTVRNFYRGKKRTGEVEEVFGWPAVEPKKNLTVKDILVWICKNGKLRNIYDIRKANCNQFATELNVYLMREDILWPFILSSRPTYY